MLYLFTAGILVGLLALLFGVLRSSDPYDYGSGPIMAVLGVLIIFFNVFMIVNH